jgi:hypothetical protein
MSAPTTNPNAAIFFRILVMIGSFSCISSSVKPKQSKVKNPKAPAATRASSMGHLPRAAAARRPTRIVKLIDHAKSTDAAHGCSTLLKAEEAAIGATASSTTRILRAPSSIIAGQAIFAASPLPISFIAERILCRGDAGP